MMLESDGQLVDYVVCVVLKKALGQHFLKAKAATTPHETSDWFDGSCFYGVRAATRYLGRQATLSETVRKRKAMGQNYE